MAFWHSLGHVGSHCSKSPTFTSKHIYRRCATMELAPPCPIQMAPTREQGAFYGGWRRPRSPGPDINGPDARQLLPSPFCSATQLLGQQSESAAGRLCGKSHEVSFQFYLCPSNKAWPTSPLWKTAWKGGDSSAPTWSQVHLHKMAVFCSVKKNLVERCRRHRTSVFPLWIFSLPVFSICVRLRLSFLQ